MGANMKDFTVIIMYWLFITQRDKQQCCVFSRAQKLPQSTWQAQTVVSSSLTPQTALLVPITGPIDPVVDRRGFTGSKKDHL